MSTTIYVFVEKEEKFQCLVETCTLCWSFVFIWIPHLFCVMDWLFIAVDKQDDEVAAVVVKKCKTQPLGHVPALTDKTFPSTIHDVSTAVVNFYLPCKLPFFIEK